MLTTGPNSPHIPGTLFIVYIDFRSIECPFQIVSMQTLHYLTLSVLIPPLLSFFAEPGALFFEGGATNVGA